MNQKRERFARHFADGVAAHRRGDLREAVKQYDLALALDAGAAHVHNNRGIALAQQGRIDAALASYARAVAAVPDHADAWVNRGIAEAQLGDLVAAIQSYEAALAVQPDHAIAYNNRALARAQRGELAAAIADVEAAIASRPENVGLHRTRATLMAGAGRHGEAAASAERAELQKRQDDLALADTAMAMLKACDWRGFAAETRAVAADGNAGQRLPTTVLALVDDPALHAAAARRYVRDMVSPPAAPLPPHPPGERLRIGYVSNDFYSHATMYLLADVLKAHDRDRFDITAFSYGPERGDSWQRDLAAVATIVDITNRADAEVAAMARERRIDIGVDLKGVHFGGRPGIFAARMAPLQVNWLGYPGTMGADFIDYIIADTIVVPPAATGDYAERLVWLPGCFQPNCRDLPIAATADRAAAGLPKTAIVLASFNQHYKITPVVFAAWMAVLRAVDDSRLWLLAPSPVAQDNLRREAQAQGIDPERLVFAASLPHAEHLARLPLADLFLDTQPISAHTTASDALRMGLPLLTVAGRSFASRVAASLLTEVGLAELVVDDLAGFVDLAVALGRDRSRLAAIRARLAAARATSTLFDPDHYARKLEAAYVAMAARQQRGLPPDHIRV